MFLISLWLLWCVYLQWRSWLCIFEFYMYLFKDWTLKNLLINFISNYWYALVNMSYLQITYNHYYNLKFPWVGMEGYQNAASLASTAVGKVIIHYFILVMSSGNIFSISIICRYLWSVEGKSLSPMTVNILIMPLNTKQSINQT